MNSSHNTSGTHPLEWTVDEEEKGLRVDQFLARRAPEISRSRWVRVVDAGGILVGDQPVSAARKLRVGEILRVTLPPAKDADLSRSPDEPVEFRATAPAILFEDDEIVVLNKPTGLTVHPGHGVPLEETLAGWLLATGRIRQVGASADSSDRLVGEWEDDVITNHRLGIVHRLDRGTSGVMVSAKTPRAHQTLAAQFATREAGRLYWAVVVGEFSRVGQKLPQAVERLLRQVPPPIGMRLRPTVNPQLKDFGLTLATHLDRDPRERLRFRVTPGDTGKRAITHVEQLSVGAQHSLLECKLETGRTHQIRIHLSFLGAPILGDALYGGSSHDRLWLHAHRLTLLHPTTGELRSWDAPWPDADLKRLEEWDLKLGSRLGEDAESQSS